MSHLIAVEKSIIPACDVNMRVFEDIVRATADLPQVGAYKIGAALALQEGLSVVAKVARKHTSKPLIYDHQKAGTDIPETGKLFAATLKTCGMDAVILFPLSGPATQTAWIRSAQEAGLHVLLGAHMTHERFLLTDGGFLDASPLEKIYTNGASLGIQNYVVPGNKPKVIERVRSLLTEQKVDPVFFAPGFIAQGGGLSDAAKVAGPRWHAIVGRALYEARDIRKTAISLIGHLTY